MLTSSPQLLSAHLEEEDPTIYNILQKVNFSPLHNCPTVVSSITHVYLQEKKRQKHFINLIPSENFTSQAVLDALGSVMQSQSTIPTCVHCSPLISYQTSTQRVILVLDTTEEMSISMSRRGYVNSARWRPFDSIQKNGV